jgi:adenylate kinase family enzyme
MKRIYIIGPVGSGKTTLARNLSKKTNIKYYELDKVVWDDDNGNIKRSDKEINTLFLKIIKGKLWIIEDVGRNKFIEGRERADIIYYIKIRKNTALYRVTKRWIKQKLRLEPYNYPPTIKQYFNTISIVNSYYKKEKVKLNDLNKYKEKVIYLSKKDIKKMIG